MPVPSALLLLLTRRSGWAAVEVVVPTALPIAIIAAMPPIAPLASGVEGTAEFREAAVAELPTPSRDEGPPRGVDPPATWPAAASRRMRCRFKRSRSRWAAISCSRKCR